MSTRLKNTSTGVTIEVADEKVEGLGSEWQPENYAPVDEPDEADATPEEEPAEELAEVPVVEPKRAPGRPKKATELPS